MWPDTASLHAGQTVTHPCFVSRDFPEQAVIIEMRGEIAELSNGLFISQAELTFIETGEQWKVIDDYDSYLISSHGKVVSLFYRRQSRQRLLKVLSPLLHPQVAISNCTGIRQIGINRLVAKTFLPPPAEKRMTFIIPKDGNPLNVQVNNLQWVDQRETEDELVLDYLHRRGEQHIFSKLTTKEVLEVRALVAQGVAKQVVANSYQVSRPTISLIARGLSRRTL